MKAAQRIGAISFYRSGAANVQNHGLGGIWKTRFTQRRNEDRQDAKKTETWEQIGGDLQPVNAVEEMMLEVDRVREIAVHCVENRKRGSRDAEGNEPHCPHRSSHRS